MEVANFILPIIALALSGLTWTMGGYVAAWRKHHKEGTWQGFETKKLRDDLILGSILGVGAVISAIATDELTVINSLQSFVTAIWLGFPIVAAVDKFIVGGLFNK